ncbi:MAG: hypothetical protein ACQEXQ_28485 [Bacillota bacterium]
MRKIYVIVIFLLILLSACSNGESNSDNLNNIIFQSEGEQWEATILNDVVERDGKSYFNIIYQFKGDMEDLRGVERISFAQGTALGTQVKNIYDPTYKEILVNEGEYQEEYEEQYGIIIDEIKKRNTNVFIIEYDLLEADNRYITLDAIEKDRISIVINWETKDSKHEDKFTN